MANYLIKKGNHSASGLHFGVHFGITEQKYRVKFSKECLYTPDWENDYFKVCGWTYGLLPVKWQEGFSAKPDFRLFGVDYIWHHHYNSIRVTGRPTLLGDKWASVELCIYVYENGVRKTSTKTIIVEVEKEFELWLDYGNREWQDVDNYKTIISLAPSFKIDTIPTIEYSTKPSWGYFLFPYVGGDNVATQDTRIYLERL